MSKSNITKSVKLNWSEYQKNIFKNISREKGNAIIEARAGSSKTTVLIESFKYVPKGKKILALAFNKIIQQELKSRAPSYVSDILTFHSLGLRSIKQRFPNVQIDDYKVFNIVSNLLDNKDHDLIINICDTVAYCKYGLLDTPTQIQDIIYNFGIDTCDVDINTFIKYVTKTLALNKSETSKIDFNDMCLFPFIYNLSLGKYDFVFVDEGQDLNKSQLVMAQRATAPGGRIIICNDSYQQLYSWRLSDDSIIESMKNQPDSSVLPLPISYRCPKEIIKLTKNWADDISCPDTATQGEIKNISLNEIYSLAKPGCFILSRTNAPLIKICMNFIRRNIKANIRGRDVGKQLSYLIKKSKKKQIPSFLKWLEDWKDKELNKLKAKNCNTDSVLDRFECLTNLCDECSSLSEVNEKINQLFNDTDENKIVILSTVHKAKGLERDDVFALAWTFRVWLDNCLNIQKPNEEMNIAYVCCTRAKNRLFIVNKWSTESL